VTRPARSLLVFGRGATVGKDTDAGAPSVKRVAQVEGGPVLEVVDGVVVDVVVDEEANPTNSFTG